MRKTIGIIRKINLFELRWIYNVRFELYFAPMMSQMLKSLKLNVQLEKVRSNIAIKRCYRFLQILKKMADSSFDQQLKLKLRF